MSKSWQCSGGHRNDSGRLFCEMCGETDMALGDCLPEHTDEHTDKHAVKTKRKSIKEICLPACAKCGGMDFLFEEQEDSRVCVQCNSLYHTTKRLYDLSKLEGLESVCGYTYPDGSRCITSISDTSEVENAVICNGCRRVISPIFQAYIDAYASKQQTIVPHGKSIGESDAAEVTGIRLPTSGLWSDEQRKQADIKLKIENGCSEIRQRILQIDRNIEAYPALVERFRVMGEEGIAAAQHMWKRYCNLSSSATKDHNYRQAQIIHMAFLGLGKAFTMDEFGAWYHCLYFANDVADDPDGLVIKDGFKDEVKKYKAGLEVQSTDAAKTLVPPLDYVVLTREYLCTLVRRFVQPAKRSAAISIGSLILDKWNAEYRYQLSIGANHNLCNRISHMINKQNKEKKEDDPPKNKRKSFSIPKVRTEPLTKPFAVNATAILYWLYHIFNGDLLLGRYETDGKDKSSVKECLKRVIDFSHRFDIFMDMNNIKQNYSELTAYIIELWCHYQKVRFGVRSPDMNRAKRLFGATAIKATQKASKDKGRKKVEKRKRETVTVVVPPSSKPDSRIKFPAIVTIRK